MNLAQQKKFEAGARIQLTAAKGETAMGCSTALPKVEMTFQSYLFSISRAADRQVLNSLLVESSFDDGLRPQQKDELAAAVHKRFCQLNAAAVGPQKARW